MKDVDAKIEETISTYDTHIREAEEASYPFLAIDSRKFVAAYRAISALRKAAKAVVGEAKDCGDEDCIVISREAIDAIDTALTIDPLPEGPR